MISILRLPGWELNPNDTTVNNIIYRCEHNEGKCVSADNNSTDLHCPCTAYKLYGKCYCGLYLRVK